MISRSSSPSLSPRSLEAISMILISSLLDCNPSVCCQYSIPLHGKHCFWICFQVRSAGCSNLFFAHPRKSTWSCSLAFPNQFLLSRIFVACCSFSCIISSFCWNRSMEVKQPVSDLEAHLHFVFSWKAHLSNHKPMRSPEWYLVTCPSRVISRGTSSGCQTGSHSFNYWSNWSKLLGIALALDKSICQRDVLLEMCQ